MPRTSIRALVLGLVVAGCSGGRPPIPFELTDGVETVLTDWRGAGLTCGDPQVGMPGPAVDWSCQGTLGGVDVGARLIADRFGVQSIHAGVAASVTRGAAAAAFGNLVRATSFIDEASADIEAWLLANAAADGTMPMTGATQLGRASISSEDDGPTLYITPLGSSILLGD